MAPITNQAHSGALVLTAVVVAVAAFANCSGAGAAMSLAPSIDASAAVSMTGSPAPAAGIAAFIRSVGASCALVEKESLNSLIASAAAPIIVNVGKSVFSFSLSPSVAPSGAIITNCFASV